MLVTDIKMTMNKEDKELLLIDLSARFPHNVQVLTDSREIFDGGQVCIITKIETYNGSKYPELIGQKLFYTEGSVVPFTVDEIRPYLRPLSSMTEEEENELREWGDWELISWLDAEEVCFCNLAVKYDTLFKLIDWLNAHHFDYRGLIEKGLALEALEGMYKTE